MLEQNLSYIAIFRGDYLERINFKRNGNKQAHPRPQG